MTVPSATEAIETLRHRSSDPQLLRGFAPLVLALVLLLAMIELVPSVAPEQVIERPATTAAAPDGAGR